MAVDSLDIHFTGVIIDSCLYLLLASAIFIIINLSSNPLENPYQRPLLIGVILSYSLFHGGLEAGSYLPEASQYLGYLPLAIPLLLYGQIRDDTWTRYAGYILAGLYILFPPERILDVARISTDIILMLLCVFGAFFQYRFQRFDGVSLAFLGYLLINALFGSWDSEWVFIVCITLFSLFLCSDFFLRIPEFLHQESFSDSDRDSLGLFVRILNIYAMATIIIRLSYLWVPAGLENISDTTTWYRPAPQWQIFIMVLCLFAVFFQNLSSVYRRNIPEWLSSAYLSGKSLYFLGFVIPRLAQSTVLLSAGILLAGCLGVFGGFINKKKSLRICGLMMSMLAVFKLLLYDISLSDGILRPLCFLGAGILCFGIGYIYNKMEKQSD